MLVNNISIEKYNAMLEEKDIQTAEVTTFSDWLDTSIDPLYFRKTEKYIKIKLKLYIDCRNDEDAIFYKSSLIKQFEKCTIKFDDVRYYYDCIIDNQSSTRIIPGKYELEVDLKSAFGYVGYTKKTFNKSLNTSFNVGGNSDSVSAIVEITPTIDLVDLTLTGLSLSPIKINNLHSGKKIILNGEDCTVLEDGTGNKFRDTEMWEFPYLKVGKNNITVNKNSCNITIKYKERWI